MDFDVLLKMMPHRKALLLGACGTVQGRFGRWFNPILAEISNEYDQVLKSQRWLDQREDFDTVHHVIRFGESDREEIEIGRVSSKHAELPTASFRSMAGLHRVYLDQEALRHYLDAEVIRALNLIGSRLGLPKLAPEKKSAEQVGAANRDNAGCCSQDL
ncbi:Imm39 family immunity protein [Sulfuriroseicoccus oceanibius]|uniref:Immunity protein 39 n=1 Tax=Sulfuriroseicoccus oceanibius TaxID=2707525 RepID=A0A6B3LDG3_9BACT|nr:Imm39 family immunity protein [Sulfuriroseicoccus oceanibius]QQL44586.1 immunity protein 39 [Sulfuriroseicoccus oceanibius]